MDEGERVREIRKNDVLENGTPLLGHRETSQLLTWALAVYLAAKPEGEDDLFAPTVA